MEEFFFFIRIREIEKKHSFGIKKHELMLFYSRMKKIQNIFGIQNFEKKLFRIYSDLENKKFNFRIFVRITKNFGQVTTLIIISVVTRIKFEYSPNKKSNKSRIRIYSL